MHPLTRIGGVVLAAALLACGGLGSDAVKEAKADDVAAVAAAEAAVAVETSPPPPAVAPFPLAVGHTWTYRVSERRGAGVRILGFTDRKAQESVIAEWTLTLTGEEEGRFAATLSRAPKNGDLPSTTPLTLWESDGGLRMDVGSGERAALEWRLPPDPTSADRSRCIAHYLGGVVGSCAVRPGGALGSSPGLESGIVFDGSRPGAEVGQFLVGLLSVGIFIPGNPSTVQSAELIDFTPGPGSEALFAAHPGPVLAAVRAAPERALPVLEQTLVAYDLDAEQGAAVVSAVGTDDVLPVAQRVLEALPPSERPAIVRAALVRLATKESEVTVVAHLHEALPDDLSEAHRDALLALVESEEARAQVVAMLGGERPLLTAVLQKRDGGFDDDVVEAAKAVVGDEPNRIDDATAVVGLCSFDDGRREVMAVLLPTIPVEERPEALIAMIGEMGFDKGRIAAIRAYPGLVDTLSSAQRRELFAMIQFAKDEAAPLLGL